MYEQFVYVAFIVKVFKLFYLQVAEVGGLRYRFMDFILCCCNSDYNVIKHSYFVLCISLLYLLYCNT